MRHSGSNGNGERAVNVYVCFGVLDIVGWMVWNWSYQLPVHKGDAGSETVAVLDALHVGLVTPLSVIGVAVSVDYHVAVTSFSSGNNSYGWCCRHNVKQKCFGLSVTVVRPILYSKYWKTIDIIFLS